MDINISGAYIYFKIPVLGGINVYNSTDVTIQNCDVNAAVENETNGYYAIWAEDATNVVVEAEKLAESKLKQASEDNKAYQVAQLSQFNADADAQASQALAQANAQTDEEMKKYVANVDKAVSAILERVL